jgi:hypothetical protein
MAGYQPLKVTGFSTGLIQNREEFLLPDDAYPILQNAYVWRERIKRKKGYQLLGRLQRNIGTTDGAGDATITISPHPINLGIASFSVGSNIFTDPTNPTSTPSEPVTLLTNGPGTATLNHTTGVLTITGSNITTAVQYFPGLPVMGIRTEELQNSALDQTIFFDQEYAYIFNGATGVFQEFIPGTTWNASGEGVDGTDFFWSTNYWIGSPLISTTSMPPAYTTAFTTTNKLFWETNGSGHSGANADPPRITDGVSWLDFYHDTSPTVNSPWAQIDAGPTWLTNWLCNLPYRGRMVVFNTWEGASATSAKNFSNRIRWSTIGNPFITYANSPAVPLSTGSWRDDIRGQGGFLDIPTSEDIISIGFVRDNLVIYCERSTWQLRYTGRSISPFQIEKVNSELGGESTFAAVQFDTSLISIGDKGVVECDSYKSERIDIKIPDFVFDFNTLNNGVSRVQGIRDFTTRIAYWTVPLVSFYPEVVNTNWIFPTARLVYNYENDSWAIFNDSLTTLGTFQLQNNPNWLQIPQTWIEYEKTWLDQPSGDPVIVGGNQQGVVEKLDQDTVNDVSLYISNIINNGSGIAQITSPNHNMQNGFVIGISGIPATTPFSDLNGGIYAIAIIDQNNFTLRSFNTVKNQFDIEVVGSPLGTYVGGGLINIRENFYITSKKFNFLDDGQNIQMGYLDILMPAIANGEISLYVYLNYDDQTPSNTLSNNQVVGVFPEVPDTFFNTIIPTSPSSFAVAPQGTKFWQRVNCPTRANFITLKYTFSNLQMSGTPQQQEVQIDAQVLWLRKAGRLWQG